MAARALLMPLPMVEFSRFGFAVFFLSFQQKQSATINQHIAIRGVGEQERLCHTNPEKS